MHAYVIHAMDYIAQVIVPHTPAYDYTQFNTHCRRQTDLCYL